MSARPAFEKTYGSRVETFAASARPAISGCARTALSASSTDDSPARAIARIEPAWRRWRTSERVSIPVRATTPRSWSQSVHPGPLASRMTTARAWAAADSERTGATP